MGTEQQFATWVGLQSQLKKPNASLNHTSAIGFNRRADQDQLSRDYYYMELMSFKESQGHCDVLAR